MQRKDWAALAQAAALLSQLGFSMVASIGVGFFLGRYLDRLVKSRLVFTLIFLAIGIGAGFITCYKLIMQSVGLKKDESTYDEDKTARDFKK